MYILPGRMIARYWSQHTAFTNMHEKIVINTRPPLVPLASLRSTLAKVAMIPVQSTIPPNTIAHMISEIVHIMFCIPPPERSSTRSGFAFADSKP